MITTRPATADDRALVAVVAATIAASAAVAVLAAPWAPAIARGLPACAFHVVTGAPCPACGTGRAVLALLRGEPFAAFAFNPLSTLALLGALAFTLATPAWLALRGPVPVFAGAAPGGLPHGLRAGLVGIGAAQWVYLVAVGR